MGDERRGDERRGDERRGEMDLTYILKRSHIRDNTRGEAL